MEKQQLKFGRGNAKLGKEIWTFSLPAGHSCPGARKCLSTADPDTGKIKDGLLTEFRCFAASQEALYVNTRTARWHNYNLLRSLRTKEVIRDQILQDLPEDVEKLRIHVSGDFYAQHYFDAWLDVAEMRPNTLFYAYTKSLRFWVHRMYEIPSNLLLVASEGGVFDRYIEKYGFKSACVVLHPDDAEVLGLEVDHDDSHAYTKEVPSFALLLHGTQPAGSHAAQAQQRLREEGIKSGYNRNHNQEEKYATA